METARRVLSMFVCSQFDSLTLQFTYVISFSELVSILIYQTSFWVMAPVCFLSTPSVLPLHCMVTWAHFY